ncbi:unnamed protein product [Ceratitis capitata]|uniref:(Mediterranean fruit fly) hypothetical protein n=1 Tax=Ceratitis capitata TaxID=7213 RepID=A0A811UTE4_CERCA|nr:unnamed protein product [Ceratitis capitata]
MLIKELEAKWRKVADKLNANGAPQRSVVEWKKSATGGGPFHFSALTEMEKSIDRIPLLSKAAAPSGLGLGIVTLTIQPTMAALSLTTTPPVLSQSSSTITAPLLAEKPIVHSTPYKFATKASFS